MRRNKRRLLDLSFYRRDALVVAPELLGMELWRGEVGLRITEVEAYRPGDSACHGRFGRTERNASMWGPAGRAYVFVCYGLHNMLNVVTNRKGEAGAVLVRACEPISGQSAIRERRGDKTGPVLLTGPGKVGAALSLDTSWNHHPLFETGGLELRLGDPPGEVLRGPRVGIDYALPHDRDALWRFAAGGTRWVSRPGQLAAWPQDARRS